MQKDNSPSTRSVVETLTAEESIGEPSEGDLGVGWGGVQVSSGKAGSRHSVSASSDISWSTSLG